MDLKEFQELPIGTVLTYNDKNVEVKVSKNCTINVHDAIDNEFFDAPVDFTGWRYNYLKHQLHITPLKPAPSYQWMFDTIHNK